MPPFDEQQNEKPGFLKKPGFLFWLLTCAMPAIALVFLIGASRATAMDVTVTAREADYGEVPVAVTVPAPRAFASVLLRQGEQDAAEPCQFEKAGDKVWVSWIVRDLKKGASRTYRLEFSNEPPSGDSKIVAVSDSKEVPGGLDVLIDGAPFTTYYTKDVPRPFCYPIIGPTGRPMTRDFPMKKVAGETTDHPHHRSFWFTFDPVNHVNFWADSAKNGVGRIVHRGFDAKVSGPVFGLIRAANDWIGPDGKKVCEDTRDLRVYHVADGRLLDFEVTMRAGEGPITFGDSKEGMFAFRVADSMRVKGGGGHIENSRGLKDGAAWGKPAEWCDYYGPVAGETVGIAILDHPSNHGHPTFWHARDYGLFAANPFGLRAFTGDKTRDGSFTVPAGGTIRFRYRVFLHKGSASEAKVADVWAAYAIPPEAALK